MTFNTNIAMWILSMMTALAVMESAAAARVLSAGPMSLPDATTVTSSDDNLLQWLKITAVPLGVFLVGASIWGCIKNFLVWRRIFGPRGHLSDAHARDEVQIAEHANNSRQDGSEVGLTTTTWCEFRLNPDLENRKSASAQDRLGDGPAVKEQTVQTMQQPTLQSIDDAATAVAPQLKGRAISPVRTSFGRSMCIEFGTRFHIREASCFNCRLQPKEDSQQLSKH